MQSSFTRAASHRSDVRVHAPPPDPVSPGAEPRPDTVILHCVSRWRELDAALDWDALERSLGLSPREMQIVRSILAGKKQSLIALDLQLGLGTVKTYCQRVYRKLDVRDQRELALAVLQEALLGLSSGQTTSRQPAGI